MKSVIGSTNYKEYTKDLAIDYDGIIQDLNWLRFFKESKFPKRNIGKKLIRMKGPTLVPPITITPEYYHQFTSANSYLYLKYTIPSYSKFLSMVSSTKSDFHAFLQNNKIDLNAIFQMIIEQTGSKIKDIKIEDVYNCEVGVYTVYMKIGINLNKYSNRMRNYIETMIGFTMAYVYALVKFGEESAKDLLAEFTIDPTLMAIQPYYDLNHFLRNDIFNYYGVKPADFAKKKYGIFDKCFLNDPKVKDPMVTNLKAFIIKEEYSFA